MIDTPRVVETTPVPIAKLYAKVPTSEIGTRMGSLLRELGEELQSQNVKPVGPWFTHHFRRPEEFFDFEVCLPVERPISANGRVEPGEWPAMKMIQTVYTGPYQGLVPAWGEFMRWIEKEDLPISDEIWERYLVNPDTESDPEKWRTELNRPLK